MVSIDSHGVAADHMVRAPVQGATAEHREVGLDVLRGIAVSLVLVNHASDGFGGSGIIGVSIFFVLSGYLITGVLERGLARAGTGYLRRFYLHRALRLFPPLVLMLAVFALVEGLLNPSGQRGDLPAGLAVALTYTSNLPPFDIRFDALFHLWTLAVEEQFYLLWPLVVAVLAHRWGWRRTLAASCLLAFMGTVAVTILTYPEAAKAYTLPTSWALALLAGAAVYVGKRRLDALLDRNVVVTRAAVVLAVLVLGTMAVGPWPGAQPALYVLGVPTIAVCAGLLVARMRRRPARTGLLARGFAALGTISYAAYLWNLPIVHWLGEPTDSAAALVPVVMTLAAATASWWLVERPARMLRARLDARADAGTRAASSPVGSPATSVPAPDARR